jgi:hypothetical protein
MTEDRLIAMQALYQQAFRDFGSIALWNMRPIKKPAPADALAITAALRTHGRMDGRRLAERIEALCRADQKIPVRRAAVTCGAAQPGQLYCRRHRHQSPRPAVLGGHRYLP